MKSRFVLVSFFGLFAYFVLTSYSRGYGTNHTGATGSTGCSCHGTTTSVSPTVGLYTTGGTAVTSYTPGTAYVVKLKGTSNSNQPDFGYELSVVKATGAGTRTAAMGGTWGTAPSGSGTSGIIMQQNQTLAGSGGMYSVSVPWTAPATGTGSVKIYGIINAVDGTGGTGGDGAQIATNNGLTITEAGSCPTVSISGTGTSLTATVTGGTDSTYQWYHNGTAISGATGATYSISAGGGSYTVSITAPGGCTNGSNTFAYTCSSTASVTASGSTLTANVSGGTATSYQWYGGSTMLPGATSATYHATTSGPYSVHITTADGCIATSTNYNYTTGINDLATTIGLNVRPSLVNDHMTLSFDLKEASTVSISALSIQGQEIKAMVDREAMGSGAFERSFDMTALPTGIYLIKVQTNNGYAISRIVKE